MASVTGMVTGNLTDLNLQQSLRVGDTLDPGTQGQVLISNGEGNATEWGTNSTIVPNGLTAGTNITYSSGNASWDGGVADTINATSTTYTASSGMKLIGNAFLTDNDGTTINNSGGTGAQNQVLKVPNALTAGTNVNFSSGTTYDGSAAITINSTDTNTEYTAGDGISIGGTVIETKIDEDTIDYNGSAEMEVIKVPNSLTAGTNVTFSSGTTYDGSAAITINTTDTDTTYQGGDNITIDTSTNPDTIDLDKTLTDMTSITFNATGTTTAITGSSYYMNPGTTCTYLDLTSSTNIIHPPNVFDYAGDLRMSIEMGNFYPNDDSSYFNIAVEDDGVAATNGTIRVLTSSLEVCGYFIIPNNYTATAVRIDINNASGVAVSRTIVCQSVTTYGGTGYTSLNFTGTSGAEFSLSPTMAGASDKIMLIKIYTTSTSDHIRGGYIKLTR